MTAAAMGKWWLKGVDEMAGRAEFMARYAQQHHLCPQCHTHSSMRTMVGYVFDPAHPEAYRDENDVRCKCGWRGIVHELQPRAEEQNAT